jgi:hypothetical protein
LTNGHIPATDDGIWKILTKKWVNRHKPHILVADIKWKVVDWVRQVADSFFKVRQKMYVGYKD